MNEPDNLPIRDLTSTEATLARELAAARRAIELLSGALRHLGNLHATQVPVAVDTQIALLEQERVELRNAMQHAIRQEKATAAHAEMALTELDATMRMLLVTRDELVRATGR